MPAMPRRTASEAKSSPSTARSVVPASTTKISPGPHWSRPASTGTKSADAATVTARPTMRMPRRYGRSSRGRMRSPLFASERLAASSCHTRGGIPPAATTSAPIVHPPQLEAPVHVHCRHSAPVATYAKRQKTLPTLLSESESADSLAECRSNSVQSRRIPVPKLRVHNFSVSIDGYAAGPNQSLDNPLGVRGDQLHNWAFGTRTFHKIFGEEGGDEGVDDRFAAAGEEGLGATIMGRNML